jgi:predicted Zn-dependent protease
MNSAQHNDAQETAAAYQAAAAMFEADSGNREQARADADTAMKLSPNRNVQAMTALVLARAGDTPGAEKLAAELDKAFPLDTLVQRYWLPMIRAAIAMQRNDPSHAIELLQTANDIELYDSRLLPAYLRGEAYLMLHDGTRAATEFQKFIDHRGLVRNLPWGALARLGLARAYAMQGDTTKARAAYQEFLTIWKDADPDVPILKQAQTEYSKLKITKARCYLGRSFLDHGQSAPYRLSSGPNRSGGGGGLLTSGRRYVRNLETPRFDECFAPVRDS